MKKLSLSTLIALLALVAALVFPPSAQALVNQQWAWRSPGPQRDLEPSCGLGVDSLGNAYLACRSQDDIAIFKFSPGGLLVWRVNWPLGDYEWPQALAVEASGNVFVLKNTLTSWIISKYSTQGQVQWTATYNNGWGEAMALDEDGNLYVTGDMHIGLEGDITTIKYNAQGVQQWLAEYEDTFGKPMDLAVDDEGNICVAGYSWSSSPGYNFITLKYDSQGVQQWVEVYPGPTSYSSDRIVTLAVDAQANVYVAGTTNVTLYDWRFVTLKYSPNGVRQWVALYDPPYPYRNEKVQSLALDSEGNVVVVGFALNNPDPGLGIVLKYSPEGVLTWGKTYPGLAYGVATDAENNIYVTGAKYLPIFYPPYKDRDCLTQKFDAQGNLRWAALYDTSTYGCIETATHIALDRSGNVIVDGHFVWYEQVDNHPLLVKYHQTPGNLTATMIPAITPVQIPAEGGSFTYDLLTVNGASNNLPVDYWWQAIYPDSVLPTLLPGLFQTTLSLDSTTITRSQRVPGNAPAGTYQYLVNVGDYSGLIWATDTIQVTKSGSGNRDSGFGDWSCIGEDFPQQAEERPAFSLSASPNPFNPTTAICYELRAATYTTLNVYDISGRMVADLVEGWQEAGMHQILFDGSKLASGLYFLKMRAGDFTAVTKLMLVK